MSNHFKAVEAIYPAGFTRYEDLDTWRVMPSRNITIEQFEPFIFLNHHGPQTYAPGNNGLPFGPHPHKGFETVTFIVSGELVHQDSTGYSSNIRSGGIQWMTAGKGIIHSETSSDTFKAAGGEVEILQLWLNLPARFKNTPPAYTGLQQEEVPVVSLLDGAVKVHMVSGSWEGKQAPIQSIAGVHLATVSLAAGAQWSFDVPEGHQVLYYVISGKLSVNGNAVETHDLLSFGLEGTTINSVAETGVQILVGHAPVSGEPIVAHGPFVMNTQEEIRQAFVACQSGAFGTWSHG